MAKKTSSIYTMFTDAEEIPRSKIGGISGDPFLRVKPVSGKLTIMISSALHRELNEKGVTVRDCYATLRATPTGMLFVLFHPMTAPKPPNSVRVLSNHDAVSTAYININAIQYEIPEGEWEGDKIHVLQEHQAIGFQLEKTK